MRFGNIITNDFVGDGRQRNRYPSDAAAIFDHGQVFGARKPDTAEIVSQLFRFGSAGFPELRLGFTDAVRQVLLFGEDGMEWSLVAEAFPGQTHALPELA